MQDSGHTSDWPGERVERLKANGKRVFSTAFKVWLVDQASRPGVSVAALAMRHEINANQLRRWMRLGHLRPPVSVAAVLPVVIEQQPLAMRDALAESLPSLAGAPIEIEVHAAVVRVPRGTDPQHLRMVLQALRG